MKMKTKQATRDKRVNPAWKYIPMDILEWANANEVDSFTINALPDGRLKKGSMFCRREKGRWIAFVWNGKKLIKQRK